MSKKPKSIVPPEPKQKPLPEGEQELFDLLKAAAAHLDYCGWGDSWERECVYDDKSFDGMNLPDAIEAAVAKRME